MTSYQINAMIILRLKQKKGVNFMEGYNVDVHWRRISILQKLSEDFIKDKVNREFWENIILHQDLSEEFIREFKDVIEKNIKDY